MARSAAWRTNCELGVLKCPRGPPMITEDQTETIRFLATGRRRGALDACCRLWRNGGRLTARDQHHRTVAGGFTGGGLDCLTCQSTGSCRSSWDTPRRSRRGPLPRRPTSLRAFSTSVVSMCCPSPTPRRRLSHFAVQALLADRLASAFPDVPLVAEEDASEFARQYGRATDLARSPSGFLDGPAIARQHRSPPPAPRTLRSSDVPSAASG